MELNSLNHFKSVTAHQFFVQPADQNYLLARWMLLNGFCREYFWQASQAIEKYLKAGLVLNDCSLLGYSHKLTPIHNKHQSVFEALSPQMLQKPGEMREDLWTEEELEKFICRVSQNGDPNSRYGQMGWQVYPGDLFKLDQLAFALRRLTVGLDWIVDADWGVLQEHRDLAGLTFRDALLRQSRYEPRGEFNNLDRLLRNPGERRADLLHAWNFEFSRAPEDLDRGVPRTLAQTMVSFENSYLGLYWSALNEPGPLDPVFVQGMHWLVDNIKLPIGSKQDIQAKLATRP